MSGETVGQAPVKGPEGRLEMAERAGLVQRTGDALLDPIASSGGTSKWMFRVNRVVSMSASSYQTPNSVPPSVKNISVAGLPTPTPAIPRAAAIVTRRQRPRRPGR